MGKGYKRKTRWRTLNIGAPPGEEDEEDGIRNGYVKGQENGTGSRNGQTGHKNGRTDSAGSTTSDYASDYASAASRSRGDDSSGSPSQPKIIFNENEYTRITTPRQDVLFKKGYLSRKKVWASTASTSATPSTTESQSASHSTADGSETTEDQQLLDCKENGAEEYPAMIEPGAQVAYGTFYDHASGYYYEYPVMVVGPGPGMPGGPPMHNVLTAVPCGPVPLRPIEWVNPAFVPKLGNEQYCVVDYQTAQLGQYPTLVDENGVPLAAQTENTNGSDEAYHENGNGSASWAGSVADEEQSVNNAETQNGTTEITGNEAAEVAQASVNSEVYLETALAQQLHVTHVAVPPIPEPYVYPGHYMFGPSLINVNGVTIQSGPMVRNTGITGGPTNTGACAKRRKKKKLSRRKSRRPLGPGNAEDEEQEEEEYSSEAENIAGLGQSGIVNEAETAGVSTVDSSSAGTVSTTSHARPLNPECQEFRPVLESRVVIVTSNEGIFSCETVIDGETSSELVSSDNSREKEQKITGESENHEESPIVDSRLSPVVAEEDQRETKSSRIIGETSSSSIATSVESTEKLVSRQSEDIEGAPVDFAAEVFANVTIMAERALAPRSVVEGTPMETEIGLDATSVNFQDIVENLEARSAKSSQHSDNAFIKGTSLEGSLDHETIVPNGHEERGSSCEITSIGEQSSEILVEESGISADKRQRDSGMSDKRGSRSASPGAINRTTTPINANSQRLPESYESLVTRGTSVVSCSLPSVVPCLVQQQTRNRKYTSKAPKFVREATPGPDLDDVQTSGNVVVVVVETRAREDKSKSIDNSETTTRIPRDSSNDDTNDEEAIATGIEALESEIQRYNSLSTTTEGSGSWKKLPNNDVSNDDSGVEIQTTGYSSEHPITDAVTEWLERANSPELFLTSTVISESEPEDDELENEEPPKNLQGNPMPALSANSSSVNDRESSRLAGFGKFASFINGNVNQSHESTKERKTLKNNDDDIDNKSERNDETSLRKRKRRDFSRGVASKSPQASRITSDLGTSVGVENSVEAARQRFSNNGSTEVEKKLKITDETCELTDNDSVAGMRVAKSSRRNKNEIASITSPTIMDSCKSHAVGITMRRRSRGNDKTNKVTVMSSRGVPIENVEVKVRRVTGDENDEGIVEDEEVSVRTFEKGEIVVSIEGKVLPVDNYQPILLNNCDKITNCPEERDDRPKFSKITSEKSRRDETNDEETSPSESVSERNSLGSIEEPDVLECWEVETVEPVTTPRKNQARGTSLEGEDAEDYNVVGATTIDPAGMEIVRKYYRLEPMRDSGTSVTSIDDDYRDNDNNIGVAGASNLNSPEPIIESICSDDIPVIGERMNKIVEIMLERSGIPIDEAVEVYESCYGGKKPAYFLGFETKYRNRYLYGQDPEREGAVPCKAACCNIQ